MLALRRVWNQADNKCSCLKIYDIEPSLMSSVEFVFDVKMNDKCVFVFCLWVSMSVCLHVGMSVCLLATCAQTHVRSLHVVFVCMHKCVCVHGYPEPTSASGPALMKQQKHTPFTIAEHSTILDPILWACSSESCLIVFPFCEVALCACACQSLFMCGGWCSCVKLYWVCVFSPEGETIDPRNVW